MSLNTMEREQREIFQISSTDKRYWPRWTVNKHVEYIEKGKTKFLSFAMDLSMDGASVIIFGNPVVRNSITLRIYMENKVNVEARGRVIWNKIKPTHTLFGINFDRLSEEAQKQITYHAFELKNRSSSVSTPLHAKKTNQVRRVGGARYFIKGNSNRF